MIIHHLKYKGWFGIQMTQGLGVNNPFFLRTVQDISIRAFSEWRLIKYVKVQSLSQRKGNFTLVHLTYVDLGKIARVPQTQTAQLCKSTYLVQLASALCSLLLTLVGV